MEVGQLSLSEDQLELQRSVRDVLARACPPALVRECLEAAEGWRDLWAVGVELGWTALALGEDGLGLLELVAVLEEMGGVAAPAPFVSSLGGAAGALLASKESGAALEELAAGAVGTLALLKPGAQLPGAAFTYRDGRVTGQAVQVADATRADLIVILAEGATVGESFLGVVRPGPGVTITPATDPVDPTRPLADVELDCALECVPVIVTDALARPLVTSAAELVGVAARVLSISVEHAKNRRQFDKPIGSFQGIKHRLADCYVAIERARSLTYAAAAEINTGAASDEVWMAATLAKAAAIEAAVGTANAGVQVHGAIGMTWEHDMHLYLRRAWQAAVLTGSSAALYKAAATTFSSGGNR